MKNSVAFGSAPRREADSQPISQSVRQAISQAVSRASRQADRQTETHRLGFFSDRIGYKQWGALLAAENPAVEWQNTRVPTPRSEVRVPAGRPPAASSFAVPDPSEHKLLTPPPPPPKKSDIQSQGMEASKSKNPLGDHFIGQNNDFTRGWTSNIMPWGMLRERLPKKGGVRDTRLRLI